MATTYDKTGCGPTSGTIPFTGGNKVYTISNTVDLTAETTLVSTDIYQCLAIPADTLVMQVTIELTTVATGTALTCTVGDGTTADGWDAAVDLKTAVGWSVSAVGTDTYAVAASMGKFYDDADSIDITLATVTSITAGPKFTIYALCVDYNAY